VTRGRSLAIAVLSAAAFAAVASLRLADPGLYYDEVHQVPAVFAWQGAPPGNFCKAVIGGVPWLTMTYSGAAKSALFALWLDATGSEFSVLAWRWCGIALVVAGWVWCCAAVGLRWGAVAQLAFAALLLTDATVLLTARHDWGPTGLAFALRCAFLAVWLRRDRPSAAAAFALGAIVGFALYEKLSNVVLLPALAIALYGVPRRRIILALVGLAVGALPLAVVNATTWSYGQGLISLTSPRDLGRKSWVVIAGNYLTLAQGGWVRRWVLDLPVPRPLLAAEALLMAAAVILGCVRRASRRFMLAYVAVLLVWLSLPVSTGAHHWITGTPFQYAALAALFAAPGRRPVPARLLLALLVLLRLPMFTDTMAAIAANRTAARFAPGPTRVAQRLAREDAAVVAATWGIGNQIAAFAGGRPDTLYEPIYHDGAVHRFRAIAPGIPRQVLYLVIMPAAADIFPQRSERIVAAVTSDPRWREVAVDPALTDPALIVRKFIRAGDAAARRP
jgi:hypothetical protein